MTGGSRRGQWLKALSRTRSTHPRWSISSSGCSGPGTLSCPFADDMTSGTPEFSWPALLTALLRREDLDPAATRWAMGEAITGEATPVQLAGFVTALRAKGETEAEVRGLAEAML